MLKKIIIIGLIVIAVLSAIFVWKTLQDRSEPTRPDSLINKDDGSVSDQILDALDTNETNASIETPQESVTIKPTPKPKKENSDASVASESENYNLDDSNNIYSSDNAQRANDESGDLKQEEPKEVQKADTTLKESLSDIQDKVQRKINNSGSLAGASISVSTSDKGIILSGTAMSAKQKMLAGSIANSASENATVANRIVVQEPKPVEAEKPKDSEPVPAPTLEKTM